MEMQCEVGTWVINIICLNVKFKELTRNFLVHILHNNNNNDSIIYLCDKLNSQWLITEPARIQATAIWQHRKNKQETRTEKTKTKKNKSVQAFNTQSRMAKHICKYTNCICCWNASRRRAERRRASNMLKLRMFRVGSRCATVSRTEGQRLVPLNTLIKN